MRRYYSLALLLVCVVFAVGSTDNSESSGSADSYMKCLCGSGVMGNMRGCRGNENTMECSRRHCGLWDKDRYNKVLYGDLCK